MNPKTKIPILVTIAVLACFFFGRYVYVNYKKAQAADAHKSTSASPSSLPTIADEQPAPGRPVNFKKLNFSENTTDVHDRSGHFVSKLPPQTGLAQHAYREGTIEKGRFEVLGGVSILSGAKCIRLPSAQNAGDLVTVEVTVMRGEARAYLTALEGSKAAGYVYVDVSSGHPGRVSGYLQDWSDGTTPEQGLVLEAPGEDALVVSYRVYRK